MAYFPLFVDLKDKIVVVIGGGKVAYRKVLKLLPFEAKVVVIAANICSEIKDLSSIYSNLEFKNRKFELNDIKNAFLVISATNDSSLNRSVAQFCKAQNIYINSVDDVENCSFLFPALIKEESLVIGCCTGGKAPSVAAFAGNVIKQSLPKNIGQIVQMAGLLRKELKNKVSKQKIRAQIMESLLKYCQSKEFKIDYNELYMKMQSLIGEINENELIKRKNGN